MRLAHFIQRYPPALGGSESYFARLSRYCARRGDQVSVFTSNALALDAFWSPRGSCLPAGVGVEDGVTVRRYPLWRMPGRRWLLKPFSLIPHRLWQCLAQPCNPISFAMWRDAAWLPSPSGRGVGGEGQPFDAVHASAFPYAFPIACAWRLARRLDVPFFVTPFLHLGDPDDSNDPTRRAYTSPWLRWLLREADGVFVQTPSERAAVTALGIFPDRIILQGLGVDPAECTGGYRADARRRWDLPEDGLVVGHLANNSWEKGTNDLIESLEPLWRAERPIHLLLAGPHMPNFARFWKAFAERCPSFVQKRVRRLGPLTDIEKRDFYAAIDVFALPSRSDSFGLVLLEAWANGVPCIAYRAGGIADVIRHERDGLLVSCGDLHALSESIQRICADVLMRERLGAAGLARVPLEFCWDDRLALIRGEIAERIARRKKARPEQAARALPILPTTLRSE